MESLSGFHKLKFRASKNNETNFSQRFKPHDFSGRNSDKMFQHLPGNETSLFPLLKVQKLSK